MKLKTLFKATRIFLDKNKETIGIVANFINLGLTVVSTVRGTAKAVKQIEAKKEELDKNTLTRKEIFTTVWKCYIPTTICIVSSSAGYVLSYISHKNTVAALNAACSISETALSELRDSIKKNVPDKELAQQIEDDAVAKTVDMVNNSDNPLDELVERRGKYLCYDTWSGQYFWSDKNKIDAAFNKLIDDMYKRSTYVSMNDVMFALGEAGWQSVSGNDYGFSANDCLPEIEVESRLSPSGIPYLMLYYVTPPIFDYDKC